MYDAVFRYTPAFQRIFLSVGHGVALSNVAFLSGATTQKAKAYIFFSGPENIFILNLWPQLGQQFDFNQALCRKFYHSKHFVDRTREKVGLKNARLFKEYFCRWGPGVALSNVAFLSGATTQKAKCYIFFSGPEEFFILNLWPQLGQPFDFNHALCRKFYRSKHFVHEARQKMTLKTRAFSKNGNGVGPELRSAT